MIGDDDRPQAPGVLRRPDGFLFHPAARRATHLAADGRGGPVVLGYRYAKPAGAQTWAALLFARHLSGYVVILLGFRMDELYDLARRYTLNAQIARPE
jgi:hypothetical protein